MSGSPGFSTMPLRARILSTAARTSPTAACSPSSTPSSAASSAYLTGADSDCRASRNVTSSTTYRGWPAACDRGAAGQGDQRLRPAALEEAGAVGEPAALVRDEPDLIFLPVVHPHLGDDLGHLAAVGADVLDRGRARAAGDAGQGLKAREALGDGGRHDVVPVLAGRDGDVHGAVAGVDEGEAAGVHVDDRAGEALVGDDQVGAAADEQHRLAGRVGGPHRVDQARSVSAETKIFAGPPRPSVV